LERLGGGGSGVVWKAQDTKLERFVALKFLSSYRGGRGGRGDGEADKRRFLREARAASSLDHPNICTVYEIDETAEGQLFIAMALCDGETLKAKIERGPLDVAQAADLAVQIAAGLAAAHDKGIVHRDVKPANVIVSSDGRVKIVDFGIAKLADQSRLTQAGTAVGTAGYMAPEQLRGESIDARTDVWSLGVVLFEMIAGRRPFRGATEIETVRAILSADLESLGKLRPGIPAELEQIVRKALQKQPADRYQKMEAMRSELVAFIGTVGLGLGIERTALEVPSRPARVTTGDDTAHGLIGRALGHYRVLDYLGGGGMGVVYKAEDLRLARTLALKFLPPELTRDPEAKARFLQEARAASSLDHPNICTIHEVGETDDGRLFLAMPCYDGQTLRQKLAAGRLSIDEATDVAAQIARGLAKAHKSGIVHRDIKPANLIVTDDGVVKILDFGLAKLAGAAAITRTGSSIGTPAYMSPEQARGGEVDPRTDLWSLGVVLYEMVAGKKPFGGEQEQAILYALLNEEPKPLSAHRPEVPAELERIVSGLLQKNPADRYPTVEAALADLKALRNEPVTATVRSHVGPAVGRRPRRWPWVAAAAGLLAAAAAGGLWLVRSGGDAALGPINFTRLTDLEGSETSPSLSPDGNYLLFVKSVAGNADVYYQRVAGGKAINLTADSPEADTQPAFSPDGQQIAFRSEREGGGLFVMGATGESVRRLTDLGFNPAWSPDGREIAFATEGVSGPIARRLVSQLWAVEVATGKRRLLSADDAVQPSWSPHGRRIAFWSVPTEGARRIVMTMPAEGGEPAAVTNDAHLNWNPVWSADGKFLFYVSDKSGSLNIWRVAIDEESGAIRGQAQPVTSSSQSMGLLSVAGRKIAYATDEGRANLERFALDVLRGTVGPPSPVTHGSRTVRSSDVAPAGNLIAFHTSFPKEDLYVVQPDGGGLRQLTDDPAKDRDPRWLPDGSRIVFYSDRDGRYRAWTVRPDGSDLKPIQHGTDEDLYSPIPGPDPNRFAVTLGAQGAILELGPSGAGRIRSLPKPQGGTERFLPTTWSADGTLLAGSLQTIDGSNVPGVVVLSLATGTYRKLTRDGGVPLFVGDGRHLLYEGDDEVFIVSLDDPQPRVLLAPPTSERFGGLSVSRDGKELFAVRETDEGDVWLASW
jgi:serine/threonine protein kinase/Tol biopolymer transport system component